MITIAEMTMLQNPNEQAAAAAAQARGAAEGARADAEAARQQAQAARDEAQAARREGGGGPAIITITKDGQTTTLTDASPNAIATAMGIPLPPTGESTASYVMGSITMVSCAIVFIVGMALRHRYRMQALRANTSGGPELAQRMARMETAIESVAVEIERISEGQRFTTRLLADRIPEEVRRG